MAQTISGSVEIKCQYSYANQLVLETPISAFNQSIRKNFTYGSGANKAQAAWTDSRSLATTASEEIDLQALVNAFGNLSVAKIKALIISVKTTTTGYRLVVGGAATNAWEAWTTVPGSTIRVSAGSQLVLTDFVDGGIVDATHKILKISNPSGGTVDYDIIVICEGTVS